MTDQRLGDECGPNDLQMRKSCRTKAEERKEGGEGSGSADCIGELRFGGVVIVTTLI